MEQFVVLKGIIRGCLSKDKGSKGARWVQGKKAQAWCAQRPARRPGQWGWMEPGAQGVLGDTAWKVGLGCITKELAGLYFK